MRRVLLLATAFMLGASTAFAHFHLDAPLAATTQDTQGNPQKVGPCGPVNISDVPSGEITNVLTGSMITVTVTETVSHGGHYRVALAQDPASLPADPPVTAGATDCGSAPIDANPTFPILADGLFTTLGQSQTDSAQVQLPAGMQCTNCTLQVIQFMTNHGAPCFYYHCAVLNISDNPPPPGTDAGMTPGADAGVDPVGGGGDTSGGCSTTQSSGWLFALAVGGLVIRRRRRR